MGHVPTNGLKLVCTASTPSETDNIETLLVTFALVRSIRWKLYRNTQMPNNGESGVSDWGSQCNGYTVTTSNGAKAILESTLDCITVSSGTSVISLKMDMGRNETVNIRSTSVEKP